MADKVIDFLNNIRQIESSGGKDTDHPEITEGIQSGTTAYGQYGLMPNTVKEIAKRKVMAGETNPELKSLAKMPPEQINDYLSQNAGMEEVMAQLLAERVLQRQHGDLDKAAYSWNMGHNLTPEQIEQRDYLNNPYVQKFQTLRKMVKPQK